DGAVAVARRHLVQQRTHGVDVARVVAREQLERQQRRAAARGALVLEAAAQQLELRAEAELADRAVGDGALAVVLRARGEVELLAPLRAQVGELALGALLREAVRLDGRVRERGRRGAQTDSVAWCDGGPT